MVVFLLRFDLSHDKARRHSGCRRARSSRSDIDLVVGAGDCNLLVAFSVVAMCNR